MICTPEEINRNLKNLQVIHNQLPEVVSFSYQPKLNTDGELVRVETQPRFGDPVFGPAYQWQLKDATWAVMEFPYNNLQRGVGGVNLYGDITLKQALEKSDLLKKLVGIS